MNTAVFSVRAGEFEGPLDLLLNLVEERKMLISEVSLSDVADAFLAHLSGQEGFPMGEAAHFVAVAATLLLLKSRALLPVLTLTDDEEGDIKDLETRLRLLQIMRDASRGLSTSAQERGRTYFGDGQRTQEPLFAPAKDLSVASLLAAAKAALQNAPRINLMPEIAVKAVVSLDEMIERLTKRVQTAISMSFKEFSNGATDPREVVVGFLAVLELVKRGFAHVNQGEHYSDITIEYAGGSALPRYE